MLGLFFPSTSRKTFTSLPYVAFQKLIITGFMAYTATLMSHLKHFSYGQCCSALQTKVSSHCGSMEWPLWVALRVLRFVCANLLCNFVQFTYSLWLPIHLLIKSAWKQSSWRFFSHSCNDFKCFFKILCLTLPLFPSELISFLRTY